MVSTFVSPTSSLQSLERSLPAVPNRIEILRTRLLTDWKAIRDLRPPTKISSSNASRLISTLIDKQVSEMLAAPQDAPISPLYRALQAASGFPCLKTAVDTKDGKEKAVDSIVRGCTQPLNPNHELRPILKAALNTIPGLKINRWELPPVIEQLLIDQLSVIKEFPYKADKLPLFLALQKASGFDDIRAELFKYNGADKVINSIAKTTVEVFVQPEPSVSFEHQKGIKKAIRDLAFRESKQEAISKLCRTLEQVKNEIDRHRQDRKPVQRLWDVTERLLKNLITPSHRLPRVVNQLRNLVNQACEDVNLHFPARPANLEPAQS